MQYPNTASSQTQSSLECSKFLQIEIKVTLNGGWQIIIDMQIFNIGYLDYQIKRNSESHYGLSKKGFFFHFFIEQERILLLFKNFYQSYLLSRIYLLRSGFLPLKNDKRLY